MLDGCKGCCAVIILVPLLVCALVACLAVYIATNSPDAPVSDNFKPSSIEAQAFSDEMRRATNQAQTQYWFVINFTERQLSSWLALEGEAFADEHDHVYPFSDVQAGLDDGQITFYGELQRDFIVVPLQVVLEPGFDRDGHMELAIDSVDVGGITLPNFILEPIQSVLEDVLIKPFDELPLDYYFFPESLTIENGSFVIQGGLR